MKIQELLAVAAMCASPGGPSINQIYAQQRQEQLDAEKAKALSKKQRIREQIRARRAALKELK